MFTGIVEEVGRVASIRPTGEAIHLSIAANTVVADANLGDSISVNGVCLTVTKFTQNGFEADVVPETMRRTALHTLQPGSPVNLERAMQAGGRFGGHMVSGHIDGVGVIRSVSQEDNAKIYSIETSPEIMRYIIAKGSIAIDGISLTVMDRDEESFRVSVIPHTAHMTTLNRRVIRDLVNLECDMVGKYIEQFLHIRFGDSAGKRKQEVDLEFLRQNGFAD